MTPASNVRGNGLAGFIKLDRHATCDEMRRAQDRRVRPPITATGNSYFTGDLMLIPLLSASMAVPALRPVTRRQHPRSNFR